MVHKKDSTWGSDLSTFVTGEFWWSTGQISLRNWRAWSEGWQSHPAALQQTPQNEIYPKAAERVIAEVRPSGSAGDSATARLWIFRFRLLAVRACACLGERSEPTCIRQAHARVPNVVKNLSVTVGVDYGHNIIANILKMSSQTYWLSS